VEKSMSADACPKCDAKFDLVTLDGLPMSQCAECKGTWVVVPVLESLPERVAGADELVRVFSALASSELEPAAHACPECGDKLLLGEYGAVEVDICRACKGLYLDRYELSGVLDPDTTRPCPKCSAPMKTDETADVPVHSCPSCQGLWLDVLVLECVTGPSRTADLTLDALIRTFTAVHGADTRPSELGCPTCKAKLSVCDHQDVEIDLCFSCRGIFLDPGEIEALTKLHSTGTERAVAAVIGSGPKAIENLLTAVGGWLK
jgi:Zn-finger nucleic acid-binding protein